MFRLAGLFAVVPATVLLTVSFFVLFALKKSEAKGLAAFGYVVAVLLWISALLVFSAGAYSLYTGKKMFYCPMQKMMQGSMPGTKDEAMHKMMMEKKQMMLQKKEMLMQK